MSWVVGLILGIGVVLPLGLGLALGGYRAAQDARFVAEIAAIVIKSLIPIFGELAKRKTPQEEAKHQAAFRAGREDQYNRRRDGRPPKG